MHLSIVSRILGVLLMLFSILAYMPSVLVSLIYSDGEIRSFLTSLFISQLVVHEHEHHEGEGGHHDEAHESMGGGDLTDHEKLPDAARQAGAHMAG